VNFHISIITTYVVSHVFNHTIIVHFYVFSFKFKDLHWFCSKTRTCTNQTTSWLMHSWNIFGAQINYGQTHIHKTHHGPNLGEATTFPLIVFFVPGHEAYTRMSFCPGTPKFRVPKFPKLGSCDFGGP